MDFAITSPSNNSTVSGAFTIKGSAGTNWVNVAVYSDGAKVSSDVTPSNGSFAISVNSSNLPKGTVTLTVIAFSVPAGQSGGTSSSLTLNIVVNNTTPTPGPTATPTPTPAPTITPKPTVTPKSTPTPAPTSTPTPSTTGALAVSSNIFLSSLGVNTHVDQGYDATQYVTPLQYTGIRNIRDGERNLSSDIMLHQQTGILVDVNAGADLTGIIAAARTLDAAGAFLSFEGPNEPNNFPITYNGAVGGSYGAGTTWVPVAQYQRDLYSAVKADPVLSKYPVFSPSEVGAESDNVGLQFLTIPTGAGDLLPAGTQYADYVNPHNYVSGSSNQYINNQAWLCAGTLSSAPCDGLYGNNGVTWSQHFQGYTATQLLTVPRVTTETGWDSVTGPGGERVQGIVLVNTYLAQFAQGWRYTFIYELVDGQGSTGNQGLYHADFTPKLVANYIHNMTTILADTTTIASPGRLNYSIANEPATVHDFLIQKSNGAFEIMVWGEQVSGSNNITVNLGGTHGTVNVYDLTSGTTATQTLSGVSSVPLTMSDHAMIVEVIN